jgi:hypothetical protein
MPDNKLRGYTELAYAKLKELLLSYQVLPNEPLNIDDMSARLASAAPRCEKHCTIYGRRV